MIFVTLGNAPLPFTRLARAVDRAAGISGKPFFVQQGHTKYDFKNAESCLFLDKRSMDEKIENSELVITHGGWGTIAECLEKRKRIIAVPRIKGVEHNHSQEELVRALEAKNYLIGLYDIQLLQDSIINATTRGFDRIKWGKAFEIINDFIRKPD